VRIFERLLNKRECGSCEVLKKMVDYQQRIIDRLLLERGLPPVKDKKLKLEEVVEETSQEIQGEVYGA
jgi:hypothetical protein